MTSASLSWFARHEIRLAWREWLAMMAGGRRRRKSAIIALLVFGAFLHVPAYAVVGRFADLQAPLDKSSLIVMSATILLAWALMLSQAIESVTRVFYARADLDLILSSPVKLANIFSVRIAAIALTVTGMALLFSTPFVDVLVIGGGPRWLAAFGVVIAVGLSAAAAAIALTVLLFRLIGPSRTRLVAQILAAVIGAGFIIALQIAAILSYGTLSRFSVLTSDTAASLAPDPDSFVWWPARAAFGDGEALLLLIAASLVLLGITMAVFAPRFADTIVSITANATPVTRRPRRTAFRDGSRQQALRRKEFLLLWRDPWLLSQSLMQLLYLVPPALMLWRSFSDCVGGDHPDHACRRDGGGPAGRRPCLADDIGRGRRRPGRDRADSAIARPPRQDRGGADRDRRRVRAVRGRAGVCLGAASRNHRRRRHYCDDLRRRDPALVPRAGQAQPIPPPPDLITPGDLRRSFLLDRLGRNVGAAARDPVHRNHQRPVNRGGTRGHVEVQPTAE